MGHARHVLAATSTAWSSRAPTSRRSGTRRTAFKNAGVKPPKTWTALLAAAKTLRASGTPAYSIAGADGWTLTDLFENLYLRQAGAAKYDLLATHKIKWTDPSVKTTLKSMAQVFSDTGNIYGGTSGALQTDFPTSVNNVFSIPPKAAMVMEGDFVPGASTHEGQGGHGLQRVRVPVGRRLGARRSSAAATRS